nr:ParA family protein [Lachnospiraceae bacterium]
EVQKLNDMNREFLLKNELDWIKKDYDFILIDCPPSLSMLTINAMVTSDSVLVPLQCEFYALEGLGQLIYTVSLVRERLNQDLDLDGVVFTMYDARTNLSQQVVENVKESLKDYHYHIYETLIPNNVRLAEAPSHGQPICYYDPRSVGAESYLKLAREVIKNNQE